MTDLKKLKKDFEESLALSRAKAENEPDGGTCNFDSTALFGIRWTAKVAEIFGTHGYSTTWLGRKAILISPPVPGQANRRTVGAQALTEAMKERGWDAHSYHQVD